MPYVCTPEDSSLVRKFLVLSYCPIGSPIIFGNSKDRETKLKNLELNN
jgi:hypothetical protein